ncbi:MAG: hypothetical protein ACREKI_03065, partial [Gemmatimonadota bacterium]
LAAAPLDLTADLLGGNRAALAEAARAFVDAVEQILAAAGRRELDPLVSRARDVRERLATSSEA